MCWILWCDQLWSSRLSILTPKTETLLGEDCCVSQLYSVFEGDAVHWEEQKWSANKISQWKWFEGRLDMSRGRRSSKENFPKGGDKQYQCPVVKMWCAQDSTQASVLTSSVRSCEFGWKEKDTLIGKKWPSVTHQTWWCWEKGARWWDTKRKYL